MVSNVAGGLAAAIYLLTGGLLGVRLVWPHIHMASMSRQLITALGWLALTLHAIVLFPAVWLPDGLNMAFFNALSLVTWLVVALLLLLSLAWPLENLGALLLPFCALTLILALAFPGSHVIADERPWQLQLHIILSILAYGLLMLSAFQAVLLALQDWRLRQRRPGGFLRHLPPLTTMEQLLFQLISAGFVLLSLSLLTGLFFLQDIFAQHLMHKTVLSLLAWLVFGVLLWGRWRFGWRGRTAMRWTLSGFTTLALAYFGSKMVLELILDR